MTDSPFKSKNNQAVIDSGDIHCPSNAEETQCFVALGSNMGDSKGYLQQAILNLVERPQINDLSLSRYYKSKPHGPQDQPDYLNAVVSFTTNLESAALLDTLQEIETNNNRVREGVVRWGARTLDLDLLFYGCAVIETERLTVPHPRICERAFVLYPMRDLLKSEKTMRHLKTRCNSSILECIDKLPTAERENIAVLGPNDKV